MTSPVELAPNPKVWGPYLLPGEYPLCAECELEFTPQEWMLQHWRPGDKARVHEKCCPCWAAVDTQEKTE